MRNTRHMSAPAPVSPPADVELAIRVRCARAAIASALLANVAAGVAPRWWTSAPMWSFERWEACDHLEGLLNYAAGQFAGPQSSELRELLLNAYKHVPAMVYAAGCTLADTLDAQAHQLGTASR